MTGQVQHLVGEAPLVVVPSHELDEVVVQGQAGLCVEDGGVCVGAEVGRDDLFINILQNALHGAFGSGLYGGADLVVACALLQADGQVNDGHVASGNTHGGAGQLALQFGDNQANGIDDYMVTVDEYNKILQSVYDKGYVLVDINDVWSETTGEDGQPRMVKNTLYLPEGKKPLVLSYDDTNYYPYMLENGFTYKLILGDDGKIASWGRDPQGNEVVSRDLDAIPILDKFVEEHPDFSPFGAKGCLSLTGYCGILGYRTQTDSANQTPEFEANRQKEREAVAPIIAELKRTGWTFGSHTWGHIRLGTKSLESIQADTRKWFDEVGSLVGPTAILFYPHGERPDGNDWQNTGPVFQYLQSQGFRVFCSVGIESFSYIKKDICAVICDRLHPDGTTLRRSRERYLQFYDAKDIIDLEVRPQRGVSWQ